MNKAIYFIIPPLVTLSAFVIGIVVGASSNNPDCFVQAAKLAESAMDGHEELAEVTADSLMRILQGRPPNQAALDSNLQSYHDNRDELDDLLAECS